MEKASQGKVPFWLILSVSIVVPGLVGFLFFSPEKLNMGDFVYTLPHFHGVINSLTSLVLVAALVAIKKGNVEWHKTLMTSGFIMGGVFLISYVMYHASVEPTKFGDMNRDGVVDEEVSALARISYLILLISHIVLSMAALPLVLLAFYHGLKGNYEKHKKIVKAAFPIWLYVSITGVIVYWMIRPYYI